MTRHYIKPKSILIALLLKSILTDPCLILVGTIYTRILIKPPYFMPVVPSWVYTEITR